MALQSHVTISLQLNCSTILPSVLWHCWLGVRKSIRLVKNLSDEVLVWLSVCSEVQIVCIWSSGCHCIPKHHNLLPHLNLDWFYLSGTSLPRLSWKNSSSSSSGSKLEHHHATHKHNQTAICILVMCADKIRQHAKFLLTSRQQEVRFHMQVTAL